MLVLARAILAVAVLLAIAVPAFAERAPATLFTLGFPNDSTVTVGRVEPWPQGFVKITSPEGEVSYAPVSKIQWVRDSSGNDWTARVVEDRKSLGVGSDDPRASLPSGGPVTRGLTFRPRPLPVSKSFVVFDLGVGYQLKEVETPQGGNDRGVLELDLGYMRNLSERNAVGVSLAGLATAGSERVAIRGRYRRWIDPSVGLEAAVGATIFGGNESGIDQAFPGFIGSVGVQVSGLAGARLEVEQVRYPATNNSYYLHPDVHTQTEWRAIGEMGSGAGLVGCGLLGALLIAAAIAYEE